MSFDPKNSNSENNQDNPNLNPGGGLPLDSQSSSGGQSILAGQPNTQLLDAMEQQLISVQNGQFRDIKIAFAEKKILEQIAELLSNQALYNRYIQDPTIGKVDINGVALTIQQLKDKINNQSKDLADIIDTIKLEQSEEAEFRQKREALNRLVNQSQNRIPVENAAAYITYIFERMSKTQDFDPAVTSQICDEILNIFEEKMKAQGEVSLIKQYYDWIRSYVTETLAVAKISYLRTKALLKPTGQAAAGLTMIGLAATNLAQQLDYVQPIIRSFGVPLVRDESLVMTGLGNIGRTLSATASNTLIAATNLVTRAIASHPVAATFAGLSLLLSAYWKLSPNQRTEVSKTMNELLNQLQIIWNKATDKEKWMSAYNNVCSLMVDLKNFLEDRGFLVIDNDYNDICSVHSDPSVSSASSRASSGVSPLKIPSVSLSSMSSEASQATEATEASNRADSVSLELFRNTGQQLARDKLIAFQDLINEESSNSNSNSSSSASISGIPNVVNMSRVSSVNSPLSMSPFSSRSPSLNESQGSRTSSGQSLNMNLGSNAPIGYERANSKDSTSNSQGSSQGPPPGVITKNLLSEIEPLIKRSEKRGYMSSNVEDVKGEKKVKTDEPESPSSSDGSDMDGGRHRRHRSRRHKSRRYTKKRKFIRRRRNTRRRPKRHTKRHYRK